jgi:hypothetical protein
VHLRHAERELARARATLDDAGGRRWDRRDKAAVVQAEADLRVAERARQACADALTGAKAHVDAERKAVAAWAEAKRGQRRSTRGSPRRSATSTTPSADSGRSGSLAAARNAASDLPVILGPPPATRGGLAASCGIAERLEAWRDVHAVPVRSAHRMLARCDHRILGRRPTSARGDEWDRIAALLDHAEHRRPSCLRQRPDEPFLPPRDTGGA